jgi:hypothetical protein
VRNTAFVNEREITGSTLLLLDAEVARAGREWERVADLAAEGIRIAEVVGVELDLQLGLILAAEAAFHLGCFGDARTLAGRAEGLARRRGDGSALAAALIQLGDLDLVDDDADRCDARAQEALSLFFSTGNLAAGLSSSRLLREVAVRQVPAFSTFPVGAALDGQGQVGPAPDADELVNVGAPFIPLNLPYNGVRIQGIAGHSGWIFWSGRSEEMPYVSVPLESLLAAAPEIAPYLRLREGWRFQIAPGYEDVWFDELARDDAIDE